MDASECGDLILGVREPNDLGPELGNTHGWQVIEGEGAGHGVVTLISYKIDVKLGCMTINGGFVTERGCSQF